MSALTCRNLSRSFGALRAVDDVDLTVEPGARHALIGPNGAGKSTLFQLLTGRMRADAGTVGLDGRDITRFSEVRRCRLGISQTLQHASLFASLTVAQTVALAVRRHGPDGGGAPVRPWPRREPGVEARTAELLALVGLAGRDRQPVRALSHGERKQVEVALALACAPTVLLLDEPAAGVSPAESAHLTGLLAGLPRAVTVLFVEHDLDLVFDLADRVTVLHLGRILYSGTPDEVRASEEVRAAYLGTGGREELFTS